MSDKLSSIINSSTSVTNLQYNQSCTSTFIRHLLMFFGFINYFHHCIFSHVLSKDMLNSYSDWSMGSKWWKWYLNEKIRRSIEVSKMLIKSSNHVSEYISSTCYLHMVFRVPKAFGWISDNIVRSDHHMCCAYSCTPFCPAKSKTQVFVSLAANIKRSKLFSALRSASKTYINSRKTKDYYHKPLTDCCFVQSVAWL